MIDKLSIEIVYDWSVMTVVYIDSGLGTVTVTKDSETCGVGNSSGEE